MTDIRTRIVDALAPEVGAKSKRLADVLLSLPGIAIVDETVWYITTDTFERGGRIIAGPFPNFEDAQRMRRVIERHSGTVTYWIDERPWAAANAVEESHG